jgi:hypothetical protein
MTARTAGSEDATARFGDGDEDGGRRAGGDTCEQRQRHGRGYGGRFGCTGNDERDGETGADGGGGTMEGAGRGRWFDEEQRSLASGSTPDKCGEKKGDDWKRRRQQRPTAWCWPRVAEREMEAVKARALGSWLRMSL